MTMTGSRIRYYALIVLAISSSCLLSQCYSIEQVRHQQKYRPRFIERRMTLESSVAGDDSQRNNLVEREEKVMEYSRARDTKLAETTMDKPGTQMIRHGRSRGHYLARSLSKVDELDEIDEIDDPGTRKIATSSLHPRKSSKQPRTDVESNDTIHGDFENDEIYVGATSTGDERNKFWKLSEAAGKDQASAPSRYAHDGLSRHAIDAPTRQLQRDFDSYDEDNRLYRDGNGTTLGNNEDYADESDLFESSSTKKPEKQQIVQVDIVTRFLRIIENQHLLGENCTAGTDLNLGEGVVDRYAQERFRLEANLAVNRANMLTRLWKYAPHVMLSSEYLLHASILSMVEFDEDIFAAGNCYDKLEYKDRWLYCPFAHRLQDQDGVLVKDLAVEYKYLSNSSEWFYIARKNAERVIASNNQYSYGKKCRRNRYLSRFRAFALSRFRAFRVSAGRPDSIRNRRVLAAPQSL